MLGAQDPLADGQQGGVLVAGPGRVPRIPGVVGEVGAVGQGLGVLGTQDPLTHKQVLKADGSTDTLPLPPIAVTALRIAKRNQNAMRADNWPGTCICGEKHQLVFTTRNGLPIEPRNINRAFDVRCARYGVRRITIHDTRRTCGSLLAALDVHPRVAMAILRHSKIALTMEIYTQVPDEVTRAALRRLSDQLDHPAGTRLADLDDLAADLTDTTPDDD